MKKNILIISILIVFVLGAGALFYFLNSQSKKPYPYDASGNTAGNLYNDGLFCEYNEKIYFSNPADKGRLYRMDLDGSNAKKLSTDSVSFINIYDDTIYYLRNNSKSTETIYRSVLYGICRCNLKGEKMKVLHSDITSTVSICGNSIYYEHYDDTTTLTLYKMNRDGSDNHLISADALNPACSVNGRLYFSGVSYDHSIFELDPTTDYFYSVHMGNIYMPIFDADDNSFYYIDLNDGYSLVRYDKTVNLRNVLCRDGRIVNYNKYGDTIYFQMELGDTTGLYRMSNTGSNIELIMYGNYCNINCTSTYTYFYKLNNNLDLYRVPTTGDVVVEQVVIK